MQVLQESTGHSRYLRDMMRNLAFLCVLVLCVSCSSTKSGPEGSLYRDGEPPVSAVEDNDPELAAAEAKARTSLPEFISELQKQQAKTTGQVTFSIKTSFPANGSAEHMWVDVEKFEQGVFFGILGNDPIYAKNLKLGDAVQVKQDAVEDWIIMDDAGNMRGGYTAKLLMEREAAKGR